ncbi:hypothetical protein XNC1_0293 [Xenorhabdus nematophila ATCC 19061]|uniref:Uncharacterized protein n=1 Tax=Xenorhabdus nematophila (strain ATCC 19061 / DSM 3370 / CCUG 14189 / LMG 1036 / NCIMB 9965 / AN6) TaxID=406817 RepID=D3VHN7_XENNA|nr:hypothetical protein XNC1_0293 [Xenorhabdus nematophila ATCC 19061]
MNARAHRTNNLRKCLLPRLLIPGRVGLPPVLDCRGTSPIDAAKSRLHENCLPSPGWDESRLAVMGPTPGIVIIR